MTSQPTIDADARQTEKQPGMPVWLVGAAFTGAVSALFGGYWDDAWHTEKGRDSFFIAPHLFIYVGVAGVGAALALWILIEARRQGVRVAVAGPTVRLAAISVAATLASGPIDDLWHRAFGRDAVIWSPPHMLGIVGTMALGAALLSEVVRRGPAWAACAAGLTIAAANFAVAEYDTDVPQFAEVWYLPVLALSAGVALALVRQVNLRPWAAAEAAVAHLFFIGVVSVFLAAQDFPGPALPVLVIPALMLDFAWQRGWSPTLRAAAFVGALFAAYVPARNWLGSGVELEVADILIGVPLAWAGSLPFILLASGSRVRVRRTWAITAVGLAILLILPVVALAHDPGQGDEVGTAQLRLETANGRITMRGTLDDVQCAAIVDGRVVARRAGRERAAPLHLRGCDFAGTVRVDSRGRWFTYAELRRADDVVEVWLPIDVGGRSASVSDDDRFVYRPPARGSGVGEIAGGVILYGMMLAVLVAAFRLARPVPVARSAT